MPKHKPYNETHFQGVITFEQNLKVGLHEGDIGVQIAEDGRIWICIDGVALIRFKPSIKPLNGSM